MAKKPLKPGDLGVAVTGLQPTGRVSIDGVEYSAHMESGHARKGDAIMVVEIAGGALVVEKFDYSA